MKTISRAAPLPKVVAAVIEKDGKVLAARRRGGLRFGGLWEFPGGKLERGEAPERGLERELNEEFGVQARAEEFLMSVRHRGPSLSIELLVYKACHVSGQFRPVDHDEVRWVDPAGMDETAFTAPDRAVVRFLRARSGNAGPADARG
jgi:8-oxo-dGTP diphosphatase